MASALPAEDHEGPAGDRSQDAVERHRRAVGHRGDTFETRFLSVYADSLPAERAQLAT